MEHGFCDTTLLTPRVWVGILWVLRAELKPVLVKRVGKRNSEYTDPTFPFPPRKDLLGARCPCGIVSAFSPRRKS
jgi:hypothetical protein